MDNYEDKKEDIEAVAEAEDMDQKENYPAGEYPTAENAEEIIEDPIDENSGSTEEVIDGEEEVAGDTDGTEDTLEEASEAVEDVKEEDKEEAIDEEVGGNEEESVEEEEVKEESEEEYKPSLEERLEKIESCLSRLEKALGIEEVSEEDALMAMFKDGDVDDSNVENEDKIISMLEKLEGGNNYE